MSFPTQPALHRSWLLRGAMSPTPRWGKSMSGLLEETEVTFLRAGSGLNAMGGFEGNDAGVAEYLVAMCHVELEEHSVPITEPSVGYMLKRFYWLSMAIPDSADHIPRQYDRVRFTDAAGRPVDLSLQTADMPEGVADHIEMTTEDWT